MFAIIIPYRNRDFFLKIFIEKISEYLKDNENDYKIIVSEQKDNFNFNLALSKNIGAVWAYRKFEEITHFIFNDVDAIPLKNIDYITPENVIHFINFGSVKIKTEDFLKINGYSPWYIGWGQEDNDFLERCIAFDINFEKEYHWKNYSDANYVNIEHVYYNKANRKDKWEAEKLSDRNNKIFDFFRNLDKSSKQAISLIEGASLIDMNKIKLENIINNKIYYISYNSADYM